MWLDRVFIGKTVDARWEESQHPRGKGGLFVKKGTGSTSSSGEETSPEQKTAKQAKGNVQRQPRSKPTYSKQSAKTVRKNIQNAVADYKQNKAQKEVAGYPAGSKERAWGDAAIMTLQSTSKRPTAEESKALQTKMLSNISKQLKPYAAEKYKKAVKAEPKITSDLMDICDQTGAEMFGLPYRLKSAADKNGVCRIQQKLDEDLAESKKAFEEGLIDKPTTYEELVDNFGDFVRYTQACTVDSMYDQFNRTRAELERRGYKCYKVKDTWDNYSEKKPYRGINTNFEAPDGTKFELQFHTPESLFRKEFQHGMYEEARDDRTPPARKAELNRRMFELASGMQKPKGVGKFKV